MTHLDSQEIARLADEGSSVPHVRECAACANALVDELQLRRAIANAGRRYTAPDVLRARVLREVRAAEQPRRVRRRVWLPAAAALAATIALVFAVLSYARRAPDARELVDLHVMTLASSNPVDVISTDRHTVKPWFEGRIPFAFDIPELSATPYRLIGGRVVYWQQRPGAMLQIARGGHRVSLFVFQDARLREGSGDETIRTRTWHAHGLVYVLVGDLSDADLRAIESLFR